MLQFEFNKIPILISSKNCFNFVDLNTSAASQFTNYFLNSQKIVFVYQLVKSDTHYSFYQTVPSDYYPPSSNSLHSFYFMIFVTLVYILIGMIFITWKGRMLKVSSSFGVFPTIIYSIMFSQTQLFALVNFSSSVVFIQVSLDTAPNVDLSSWTFNSIISVTY